MSLDDYLSRETIKQLGKYGLVTVFSQAVIIVGIYLAVEVLKWPPKISYLVLLTAVYAAVYVTQTKFVFKSHFNNQQLRRYTAVIIVFWSLNNLFFYLMLDFLNIQYLAAVVLNILILGLVRFMVHKKFVFKKKNAESDSPVF